MKKFEIYWDDLTQEAQERLKPLWHDNIDLAPIAIITLEEVEDESK